MLAGVAALAMAAKSRPRNAVRPSPWVHAVHRLQRIRMSTIVNLDITSSYDFFFDVIIPNISAYMADQCNMTAINAAVSLWHMHE